jgi:septum site-determining protein MinC
MVQKIDIAIKGIRQGLLIKLQGGTWDEQLAHLKERLSMGATFFKGGRAALAVDDQTLTTTDIERVQDLLTQYDVTLWALVSENDESTLSAARMGLAVNLNIIEGPDTEPDASEEEERALELETLVVERTLRSGQKAHHPGHVVVLGSVHPGAEVIAGGHVIVWGSLRGVVHAGAMGSEESRIYALELAPTQLRIAGRIARSPEEKRRRRPTPEMAQIRNGRIEATPWQK